MVRPLSLALTIFTAGLSACATEKPAFAPEVLEASVGDYIIACGERLHVGAPVVLWTDSNGYSAYETDLHFERPPITTKTPPEGELRYAPGRKDRRTGEVLVPPDGDLLALQQALELFVLHYDVCGVSQTCFKVLHDRRCLSVHFMIDVDGTIYQTLDLRDTGWHARQANDRSVGVEIAQIGAYPLNEKGDATLARWYEPGPDGVRLTLPKPARELGVRTARFEGFAARDHVIRGGIHGQSLQQYDYTPEQYDSLVRLTATLCRHFPNLPAEAPRGAGGAVLNRRIPEEEEPAFQGIVGHFHVGGHKIDPGPAFDWEPFLARVKTRLLRP